MCQLLPQNKTDNINLIRMVSILYLLQNQESKCETISISMLMAISRTQFVNYLSWTLYFPWWHVSYTGNVLLIKECIVSHYLWIFLHNFTNSLLQTLFHITNTVVITAVVPAVCLWRYLHTWSPGSRSHLRWPLWRVKLLFLYQCINMWRFLWLHWYHYWTATSDWRANLSKLSNKK